MLTITTSYLASTKLLWEKFKIKSLSYSFFWVFPSKSLNLFIKHQRTHLTYNDVVEILNIKIHPASNFLRWLTQHLQKVLSTAVNHCMF